MGDVLNLRMARKRRKRAAREAEAETNRAAHGLSAAERRRIEAERERAGKALDGHSLSAGRETPKR